MMMEFPEGEEISQEFEKPRRHARRHYEQLTRREVQFCSLKLYKEEISPVSQLQPNSGPLLQCFKVTVQDGRSRYAASGIV